MLPNDYEMCGDCGFDHEYETAEAATWHEANPGSYVGAMHYPQLVDCAPLTNGDWTIDGRIARHERPTIPAPTLSCKEEVWGKVDTLVGANLVEADLAEADLAEAGRAALEGA